MNNQITISRKWWVSKRCTYNKGLIISGFIAFMLYCILGPIVISPHEEFEVTLFTTAFQGGCYLFMIILANIIYSLGWIIDISFNRKNSQRFRDVLFALGYWFSFLLPILLILWVMIRFSIWGK